MGAMCLLMIAGCSPSAPLDHPSDGSAMIDAGAPIPDLSISDASVPRDASAADARTPTDGPSVDRDAGTFSCGPKLHCQLGTEYCYSSNFGDAGMSEWFCTSLQNCDKGDRCNCLLTQHQCFAGCRDDNGPIYFWCPR